MRILFSLAAIALFPCVLQAATYTVDNLGDSVIQSACTAAANDCSFRGAMTRANADAALDTVDFNVPSALCGTTCVINVAQQLNVTQPVIVDGSTQPGYVANTIPARDGPINTVWKMELRMSSLSATNSLTLRGLVIPRGQLITAFGGAATDSVLLEGNLIGDPTDFLNSALILLGNNTQFVRVGGLDASQRNIIVSYLSIQSNLGQTVVQGNLVGTGPDAATMYFDNNFNQMDGARVTLTMTGTADALVGGTDPDARNIIALRSPAFDASSTSVNPIRIQGNSFGIGANGTRFVTCGIVFAVNAEVGGLVPGAGNQFGSYLTLPFGRQCGVSESIRMSGTGSFLSNSVDGRQSRGITNIGSDPQNLFLPNDVNDTDFGLQNFPEIISYSTTGNQVTLTYGVDSTTTSSNYPLTVQFYIAENRNPKTLLHTDTYAAANAQQAKTVNFTLPAGVSLTRCHCRHSQWQ